MVFNGPFAQMIDEGLYHIAAGFSQLFSSAELGGVAFHEVGIESVLADQQTEAIAKPRLAIV